MHLFAINWTDALFILFDLFILIKWYKEDREFEKFKEEMRSQLREANERLEIAIEKEDQK